MLFRSTHRINEIFIILYDYFSFIKDTSKRGSCIMNINYTNRGIIMEKQNWGTPKLRGRDMVKWQQTVIKTYIVKSHKK